MARCLALAIALALAQLSAPSSAAAQAAGKAAKVGILTAGIPPRTPDAPSRVFDHFRDRERAQALLIVSEAMFAAHAARLAELTVRHRLPSMHGFRDYVDAGGLMSYGASLEFLFRNAAVFVDRILKGARPAELPVEQPARFELVINAKAARTLGLTIPHSLLVRADEIIQ